MAVYKPTYCYPFLNSFDPRLVATLTEPVPAQWLKCKIETSNKNITGYKIRILDNNNNVIFEGSKVSPISELQLAIKTSIINTGVNGTYLNIPFIQLAKKDNQFYKSYNSIYFNADYGAHYLIRDGHVGANNVKNWIISTDGQQLVCSSWDGDKLNGTTVATNEIVCVIGDPNLTKNGLWKIEKDKTLVRYNNITDSSLDNATVIILKGTYDNRQVKNKQLLSVADATSLYYQYANSNGVTVITQPVSLNVMGGSYKWEISLYQGNGRLISNNEYSISYVDYSDISKQWFDMKLNTGKILGTTPERVQIANLDKEILPSNTDNNYVILQTRWMQLLDNTNNDVGSRVYVNSYSSSLGHVYPKKGDLDASIIDDARVTKCKFFKFSNNPNSIESGDIVDCATTRSILLDGTVNTVDGVTITDNMRVLVKDQDIPQENGIYLTHKNATWVRVNTYDTWGDFIGSIIYVSNGQVNGGHNFESTANAGGTLWTKEDDKTSFSPLKFIPEQPIILFPQLLDLTINYLVNSLDNGATEIDGEFPSIGSTVLVQDEAKIYKVISVDSTTKIITLDGGTFVSPSVKYIYVTSGITYGHRVVDAVNNYTFTEDLSIADILKNSSTRTYISAYSGLSIGQALYILDTNQWIDFTKINTTLWYIEHTVLPSGALPSYDTSNSNIPYTYEIRSYFNTSEENPFYLYENPYLRIGQQGEEFSTSNAYQYFQVVSEEQSFLYSLIEGETYDATQPDNFEPFLVRTVLTNSINGRYISLEGFYDQAQQISWESYRWILLDADKNILQDTGTRYDREIKVDFYGLSNDQESDKTYYAVLFVEDSLGNTLVNMLEFTVSGGKSIEYNVNFTAQYNCEKQSTQLEYQGITSIYPTAYLTNGYQVGAYVSYNDDVLDLWDDSLNYSNNIMNITGVNGSGINIIPDTPDDNQKSYSIKQGVIYDHYYLKNFVLTQDIAERELYLQDMNKDNDLVCMTSFTLGNDYCGDIVRISIGTDDSANNYDIVLKNAENFNDDGSVNSNAIGHMLLELQQDNIMKAQQDLGKIIEVNIPELSTQIYHKIQPRHVDLTTNVPYLYALDGKFDRSFYFLKREENGETVYLNSKDCSFYNLCLGAPDTNGENKILSYWADNRPKTTFKSNSNAFREATFKRNIKELDNNGNEQEQFWPSEEEETNFYWKELNNDNAQNYATMATNWDELNSTNSKEYLQKYDSLDRWYGVSIENMKILVIIPKISEVINKFQSTVIINATEVGNIGTIIFVHGNTTIPYYIH